MSTRFSTAAINAMLDSTGLRAKMANGILRLYSGAQPASADAAVTGTLLMEITESAGAWSAGSAANGLNFGAAAAGILAKAVAETWRGVGVADGTAGWFRFFANPTDAGALSTSLARIDGSVGKGAGDLPLSNNVIGTGVPQTIDVFRITMVQQ